MYNIYFLRKFKKENYKKSCDSPFIERILVNVILCQNFILSVYCTIKWDQNYGKENWQWSKQIQRSGVTGAALQITLQTLFGWTTV